MVLEAGGGGGRVCEEVITCKIRAGKKKLEKKRKEKKKAGNLSVAKT